MPSPFAANALVCQFHLKALDRGTDSRATRAGAGCTSPNPMRCQHWHYSPKAADGGMRDALSLTDQALAHGNGHVHLDQVQAMLGTLDHRHLYQMLHCLQQLLDGPGLMQKVAEVSRWGGFFPTAC